MTAAKWQERETHVPFFRSIQAKYALTYLLVVAAILIVMNTYPLLMAENMVFSSKENTLKRQALVIGSPWPCQRPLPKRAWSRPWLCWRRSRARGCW